MYSRYQSALFRLPGERRFWSPQNSAPVVDLHSPSCRGCLERVRSEDLTSFFSTLLCPNPQRHLPFLTYLLSFDILANSFTATKNSTLLFSYNSELFRKNTRGGVSPHRVFPPSGVGFWGNHDPRWPQDRRSGRKEQTSCGRLPAPISPCWNDVGHRLKLPRPPSGAIIHTPWRHFGLSAGRPIANRAASHALGWM